MKPDQIFRPENFGRFPETDRVVFPVEEECVEEVGDEDDDGEDVDADVIAVLEDSEARGVACKREDALSHLLRLQQSD